MKYSNSIRKNPTFQIFIKYFLINILLFVAFAGIFLGKLIVKESNPFFYTNF